MCFRAGASPAGLGNRNGCPTVNRDAALRAAHVVAGAGIDLDQLAFLDEKRDVDGLAGFELRRLGHVPGGVAAQTFRGFNYLQTYRCRQFHLDGLSAASRT